MPRGYTDGVTNVRLYIHPHLPLDNIELEIEDSREDDYELVQAIVAGKVGLEPAGRSNDLDPLSLPAPRHRGREGQPRDDRHIKRQPRPEPQQQFEPYNRGEDEVAYDTTTIPFDPAFWEPYARYMHRDAKGRYIKWEDVPDKAQAEIDAYIERRYGPQ